MIHLLFTGGTISMTRDPRAGGNVPTHGGRELVEFTEGLERITPYRIEDWARIPACHMGPDRLWALRERIREVMETGGVRGIVITHGTDTMEETAYLLARTLNPLIPVAITGAMRTSSDDAWDGPRNLLDAARVAADPMSAGRGVMVVFAGKVLGGLQAVKTHASALEAFTAPHGTALGRVEGGEVQYITAVMPARARAPLAPSGLTARVALIPMVIGDQGQLLDLARPHHDGLVLVSFGMGNTPPGAVPAVQRWLDEGKPVVLSSRCAQGQVGVAYGFDGGGARLVEMGVLLAGPRTPSQARMELTIALSAGVGYGE